MPQQLSLCQPLVSESLTALLEIVLQLGGGSQLAGAHLGRGGVPGEGMW